MSVASVGSDPHYAGLARAWFESALHEALPDLAARLDARGASLNKTALRDQTAPLGEPHAFWAGMVVRRAPGTKSRVSLYSDASWQPFLAGLDQAPHSAEMEMQVLDAAGYPTAALARIGAYREDPRWLRFTILVTQAMVDWYQSVALQEAWVGFLGRQAELQESSFGNIANDNVGEETALEMIREHSTRDTVPRSGEVLRGYSWVTVCGRKVAERLGGADRLARSGAFCEVRVLSYGGLLLRATPTFQEYDDAAVRRVFEVLAPALPAGRAEPIMGYEYLKLVYDVDAADFR